MKTRLLYWDVDTQVDFMDKDGNLPVPGAARIRSNLRRLTRHAAEGGMPILATSDTHVEDDPEFEQFPPHCIGGTPGHEKIPETLLDGSEVVDPDSVKTQTDALAQGEVPQLVLQKGQLDAFGEEAADELLAELRPERVVLYGVATEYCVRLSVLGLLKRGYAVDVVRDAIKGIDEDDAREACEEMEGQGARFITTDKVVGE